jgi:ribulose-phosphate 3-epimerase
VFSHVTLAPIKDIWWPDDVEADIHVMYKEPLRHIKELLELEPRLIIVHAEADGNFLEFAKVARENDIAVGVALRPHTPVTDIEAALAEIDHVLILSGYLGNLGGYANTHLLTKVLRLKQLRPTLEIGWEGGINDKNITTLAAGGVDVFNVGSFIQHAGNAHAAYEKLEDISQSLPSKHKQL